jgi:hypothetical protein
MGATKPPYPAQFREKMMALVRSGRTPESLSREYQPPAWSNVIRRERPEGFVRRQQYPR